jgi:hypothetical protein
MDLSPDFWLGVVCGALGLIVISAIGGGIHEWRSRRAIRDLGLTPFPSRTKVNEMESDAIRLARKKRRRDRQDRDTGGTGGWDLNG